MKRIAVFFVGNRLMLDDGVGPAAYDLIQEEYFIPDNVDMFDVGCMSLDMISKVNEYDFMITVDAVDESGSEPGTVFRYRPHDIVRTCGARTSLHDTKLADLFDAAALLGYTSEGMCYGMQGLNLVASNAKMAFRCQNCCHRYIGHCRPERGGTGAFRSFAVPGCL